MISASYPLAWTPVRWRRLAISTLVAAFAASGCGGPAAPPRATSKATSPPSVSTTTAAELSPTHSPASIPAGRLAYGRFSPGGIAHVFTANTDGTDEQALLPSVAEGPRFSPDGRRIAIVVESPQGLISFGFVNPDGSDFARFDSPDPTLNLGCVTWSPDGSRLACEAWDDTDVTRQGIYTVRASDGGDLIRVTTSPADMKDVNPGAYSPDGRQLVFLRGDPQDDKHLTLMVVDVNGSNERALMTQKVGLGCDWSPDGKTILTEADGSLLVVPLDGGPPSPVNIVADGPVIATRGAWSPDGTWIVFSRVTSTGEDIYIVRMDGTNLHQVTNTPGQDEEFGEWGVPAP
jgi:Tol biopolymer transport system component